MAEKLRRYAGYLRILGILVIVGLLAVIGYQLYTFYGDKVGLTPDKAIETYFEALAQGNYEQVYQLTDKENLTDLYGRPITKTEFIQQLRSITGGEGLPLITVESEKLIELQGSRYHIVTIKSSMNGVVGSSRLVVELRKVGGTWIVRYPLPIIL